MDDAGVGRTISARGVGLAAIALIMASCGGGSAVTEGERIPVSVGDAPAGPMSHVHGLGRNPADGDVYVATHHGLWRIPRGGKPRRVSEHQHDFMGFDVVGGDHFIASGHPNGARSLPPHMGLIESKDAGASWVSRSLLGEADFHALREAAGTSYGWNSQDGTLKASDDLEKWNTLQEDMSLVDLAVRDDTIIATSPVSDTEIQLVRSTDGGRSFARVPGAPQLVRLAWRDDGVSGIDVSGDVWNSTEGSTWERAGSVGGAPEAVAADGAVLLAAADGRIQESRDGGKTWSRLSSYE